MKAVTAAQMREIDRIAIEERGVPGLTLMERAGRAVAREALDRYQAESAIILAGKGNNGGDGFVAARLLHEAGVRCRVDLFADPDSLSGDALANYLELPGGVEKRERENAAGLAADLERYDVAIDALLGTGVRGPVSGAMAEAIEALNASRAPVLAVDIPSGLPADGQPPEGPCVRAASTVTMGLPKIGMLIHPGVEMTGVVSVADLGFPRDLLESDSILVDALEPAEVGAMLPSRPRDGNKGTFGKALILAGSIGMTGAAILAARAARRSGAGLIYCAVPRGLESLLDTLPIETVKRLVPSHAGGRFDAASLGAALEWAAMCGAAALGPGLSTEPGVPEFVHGFLEGFGGSLVLDADGLNALGREPEALKRRAAPTLITPHPGEMARLTGNSIAEIQADRLGAARAFAERYGVVVALKGAQTIVADPDGRASINGSGNTGLAKGGSGDVLSGLLAGLLAQGLDCGRAARIGVFLHGLAADLAAPAIGVRAMVAGDLIHYLSEGFLALEKASGERKVARGE